MGFPFLYSETLTPQNQKAIEAFYKKDWAEAEKWFLESLKINPKDPYANYNLACLYSIRLNECEELSNEDTIYTLLQTAVEAKPSYRSLMLKDKDLSLLRSTYRFNTIAGLPKQEIFTKIHWYGPSPGAYGPVSSIVFEANGRFTFSMVQFRENDGALERPKFAGTYVWISDQVIELDFQKVPKSFPKQTKRIKATWKQNSLKIEGFEYSFTDSPDRCSA
ncbi:tetratricopeptide repeat protein [Leptospira ryugenii]|uniref:tetratricopeptide repeat protein n=1 Tax=Leptospira ryugenii TaxID=1917863 RepID=UPI001FCECAFE|nr:hypothetical protein [Leptospira ryugenii]